MIGLPREVAEWLPIFRGDPLLPRHPKTEEYWQRIGEDPIATRLIDETRKALQKAMSGAGGSG